MSPVRINPFCKQKALAELRFAFLRAQNVDFAAQNQKGLAKVRAGPFYK